MPSFLWTRESNRLLVALGPPPSLMLAYLADPDHKGSRRWPLRTVSQSARANAIQKLSPTQSQVLAAENASLADVKPKADADFARGDYTASLQALAALRTPVDKFFDEVMVNAEDPALRANRLGLLATLHEAMNRVADLSKLSA